MKRMGGGIAGAGRLLEWSIQRWISLTGRTVIASEAPWLAGPTGGANIGAGFYQEYARSSNLEIALSQVPIGLVEDFSVLEGPNFAPERVDDEVRRFYERTSLYSLDVWSAWTGPFKPFAYVLIRLVSRDIQQLNLPTSPLATSQGVSSELIRLVEKETGKPAYTGWLRKALGSGEVIYAGFYATCEPPGHHGRCVKVVFPLPGGSATVILEPQNQPDGSLKLVSAGKSFGDPGYYRIHWVAGDRLRVRYIPIKEMIHVFVDQHGDLRTDHRFRFGRWKFLDLHYKITRRPGL